MSSTPDHSTLTDNELIALVDKTSGIDQEGSDPKTSSASAGKPRWKPLPDSGASTTVSAGGFNYRITRVDPDDPDIGNIPSIANQQDFNQALSHWDGFMEQKVKGWKKPSASQAAATVTSAGEDAPRSWRPQSQGGKPQQQLPHHDIQKKRLASNLQALSYLVQDKVTIDEHVFARQMGIYGPVRPSSINDQLQQVILLAKSRGPRVRLPAWLRPARASKEARASAALDCDSAVTTAVHEPNTELFGHHLAAPKSLERMGRIPKRKESPPMTAEAFAALPESFQNTLTEAHPELMKLKEQLITERVKNRLASQTRTPAVKRKPRRPDARDDGGSTTSSIFSSSGFTPDNKKATTYAEVAHHDISSSDEENHELALPPPELQPDPEADSKFKPKKKASAVEIGAKKGDITLAIHSSLTQRLPVAMEDWKKLRNGLTKVLQQHDIATRLTTWKPTGVTVMAVGRKAADVIKEWIGNQAIGEERYRAWEDDDSNYFRITVKLPNAVVGPWEDFLGSLFERSNLSWDGHLGKAPFCTSLKCGPQGNGRVRLIHVWVDRILLQQIIDKIDLKGERCCFPALDALLAINFPRHKAETWIGNKKGADHRQETDVVDRSAFEQKGEDNANMETDDVSKVAEEETEKITEN